MKKLAEGIDCCVKKEIGYKIVDEIYDKKFQEYFLKINLNKLGFFFSEYKDDEMKEFVKETFSLLQNYGMDLTFFFRSLAETIDVLANDLISVNSKTLENLISQYNSDVKIRELCKDIIEKIESNSLPFQLRAQNNKLDFPHNMLSKWENLLNSIFYN